MGLLPKLVALLLLHGTGAEPVCTGSALCAVVEGGAWLAGACADVAAMGVVGQAIAAPLCTAGGATMAVGAAAIGAGVAAHYAIGGTVDLVNHLRGRNSECRWSESRSECLQRAEQRAAEERRAAEQRAAAEKKAVVHRATVIGSVCALLAAGLYTMLHPPAAIRRLNGRRALRTELLRAADPETTSHTKFCASVSSLSYADRRAGLAGLASHLHVDEAVLHDAKARGEAGLALIAEEFAISATEVQRQYLEYVLHGVADGATSVAGETLDVGRRGERLSDFCRHESAVRAGLLTPHVVALRLYSTGLYSALTAPMRDAAAAAAAHPHPFAITVAFIDDAVKKLRRVDHDEPIVLYRGVADVSVPGEFLANGGTEVAMMSTTTDLRTACDFAVTGRTTEAVLLRLRTTTCHQRGADISFLSAFPAECERLFPPLTYLQPCGFDEDNLRVGNVNFRVLDVVPILAC